MTKEVKFVGKIDLINGIYDSLNKDEQVITKDTAQKMINALIDTIQDTVADGGEVRLTGFGSFKSNIRKERKGRNPMTGKDIIIPEKRVVKFNAGKQFRELVEGE